MSEVMLLGYPNRSDLGTITGGSWVAGLPLTNLQDTRVSKVARSSTDSVADAQFENDLGANYLARSHGIINHNLSVAANVRVRGWPDQTFTRSGSVASYLDEDQVIQQAVAANIARQWNYEQDSGATWTRTTLLEGARTNICLQSEAMGTTWVASNVTVADDSIASPDGTVTADTLTASAGNATLIQDLGVIGSTANTFSIYLQRLTGTGDIDLTLDGGATWTTVTLTTDWARFNITQTLANPDCGIRIVTSGDAVYAWGGQVEAASHASSYIQTVGSTVTRNAETMYLPYTPAPQAMSLYVKVIDWAGGQASGTLAHIGSATAATDPRLTIAITSGGTIVAAYDDGVTPASTGALAAPSAGDDVEVCVTLTAAGVVDMVASINGGADVDVASAAGGAVPAAWADTRMYLNSAGSSQVGFNAFASVVAAAGVKTLAEMRALDAGDEDTLLFYSPEDSEWQLAFPDAYPAGSKLYGEERGGDSLSAADRAALERMDYWTHLDSHTVARYWSVEFDDTANTDTYIEFGRLWICPDYEPAHNLSVGVEIGHSTSSTSVETEGGGFIHEQRPRRRAVNFALEEIGTDEMLVQVYELLRAVGTTEQLMFAYAADDTVHKWRRTFLAVNQDLDLLKYPKFGAFADQSFSLVEEI